MPRNVRAGGKLRQTAAKACAEGAKRQKEKVLTRIELVTSALLKLRYYH